MRELGRATAAADAERRSGRAAIHDEAVGFTQEHTERTPRGSTATYREVGWIALDTTRTTSDPVLAERLLHSLPYGFELLAGHDVRRARVPDLAVHRMGFAHDIVIVDERGELEEPIGGSLGWHHLARCVQLGWSGLSLACSEPRGRPSCQEPLASGARIDGECSLDQSR